MLEIDHQAIQALAEKYDLKFVVLFGSRATGQSVRADSDYDIAVYSRRPERLMNADLDYYTGILFGLAGILKVPEDKIDLTDLRHADSLLRHEITRVGRLLSGDELEYEEFKLFAVRDYLDTQDLRDLEDIIIRKKQLILSQ